MTNEELRTSIVSNILSDDFLVLQCPQTTLIANQYTAAIAENKDLEIVFISELDEINDYNTVFDDFNQYLFVIHTDSFAELKPDYSIYENVVVICSTIDKKVSKLLDDYIVKMDKIEQWQQLDYIEARCPGLTYSDRELMYQVTQGNCDRMDSLLDQISLFNPDEQSNIFSSLLSTENTDLYFNTAFNLVDAVTNIILNNNIIDNMNIVKDILLHRNCCDITTLYVITILLAKLRNIAIICYGGKSKATSFLNKDGKPMSDKQYYYYQRAFAPTATTRDKNAKMLSKAISILSRIDSEVKQGKIELTDSYFLDYVLTQILL